ncbi:MAG: tetratricopeptide repeat protein [Rikenellaceae bacterium]|jgi:tetratricopeptide (TPR) repeat protein|nr:tetratricopeptide repeat protein [Rikenellaceae bacterium]
MRGFRSIRRCIIAVTVIVAAFCAVTSYGQYNKAYFFWMGRGYLVENRYREAIRIYNALLRVDPEDYEAYFFRGIAKANLDDNLGAEADFTLAIEHNPVYTMAYQHRAITRMLLGNYDDALSDFAEAITLRPDLSGPYYSRGYTFLMNRQFERAVEDFTTFIFHNNRVADAYILRGMSYLQLGDTLSAMKDYDTAIFTNRDNPEGYNRRGAVLMEQERYAEALADFETAVARDTTYTYSLFNRALAHERLSHFAEALADLDRVISMASDNPVAYYNRAIVRTSIGDFDGAIADYDRVSELSPDNVVVYYNRALLKTRRGDWEAAAADYTRAIELYPDFAAAYMARSELRYLMKDTRGARQDRNVGERKIAEYENRLSDSMFVAYADSAQNFTRLLSFETKFTGSNFDRLAANREDLALLPLFRFTLHTPDTLRTIGPTEYFVPRLDSFQRSMAMENLAFTRLSSDIPTERVMELDRAVAAEISAGDDGWQALFRRGVTQSLIKQFTNSVNTLSHAIEKNATNPFLYINRSTTQAEMIDFISSIDGGYQRMTIESDPAYRMRGSSNRIYNYDEAIADLNKAAKLMPELAYIYYNRANLLVMSDRLPEAFEDYSRAIELNPYFAEAYYNRGLVQIYMKDTRKGYLDISKAGELGITGAYDLIDRYNPNPER